MPIPDFLWGVPLAVVSSWEAVSFALVLILAAVVIVTALSVVSAVIEMVVYAGAAALIIGAIFYFVEPLSFNAAWQYLSGLLPLLVAW